MLVTGRARQDNWHFVENSSKYIKNVATESIFQRVENHGGA
jgi:hypothetical protein